MYKYFVVSYDLHRVRNYEDIEKGIDIVCVDYVKPLESVYIIKTEANKSAGDVRDTIARYADNDDSILVIECNINSWGTKNISKATSTIMKAWK